MFASAALCAIVLVMAARSGGPVRSQEAMPPPSPQIKAAPPTPIAIEKVELEGSNPWNPDWDVMIEKALPLELLSKDLGGAVRDLCPRFGTMTLANRRAFWAYFFQALAGAEAGLVPTANVRHMDPELQVRDDVTHRMVRQEGLLQLTYMDQERYGCDFDWEQDRYLAEHDPAKTILQPKNNLLCGVNIIRNQLIDQHKPLLSSTSYFATLQPGTISVKVFLKQMANVPAVCGRWTRSEPRTIEPAREATASMRPRSPLSDPGSRSSFASEPAAAETH